MLMGSVRGILLVLLGFSSTVLRAEQKFPEWRGAAQSMTYVSAWSASPIVIIGKASNVRPYGEEVSARFPSPMPSHVHTLYWCVADLHVLATVKGVFKKTVSQYVWASLTSGCNVWLWPDNPQAVDRRFQTRAWFVREEGPLLRPTLDTGMPPYMGLFTNWENVSSVSDARRHFGELLFTPSANSDSLGDYAEYLPVVFDIACELLGKADCALRLAALSDMNDVRLQQISCGLLKGEFGRPCRSR